VLSRTLGRLSADAEHLYGDPVLLVETFTDPSRHEGTCYRAANFVEIGTTSRYALRNGSLRPPRQLTASEASLGPLKVAVAAVLT